MGLFVEAPDTAGRIGFTGTREKLTAAQRKELYLVLLNAPGGWWHHGDCVGADAESHVMAYAQGYKIEVHPPLSKRMRAYCKGDVVRMPKEFIARERDIVRYTSRLIACPAEAREQPLGGTWSTIRFARWLGRPVMIIFPDGRIELEQGVA